MAFVAWTKLGVPNDGQEANALLQDIVKEFGKDDRHPVWFIEDCGEGIQQQIVEAEAEYIRHIAFNRPEKAACLLKIERLRTQLKMLACLRVIFLERSAEKFADGIAAMFSKRKPPAKK